jgi:hypothetical protein
LIATRPEDRAAIEATTILRAVARYVTPVFIEIPPCPPDRSGCQHMGIGHRITCDMAARDEAYGCVLTPDSMLSDGSVSRLQELARSGTQLVLAAALRFGEEPFLAHLRDMSVLPGENRSASGAALTITGRQMVYAAVNGFHSETLAYEWDAPGVLAIVPAAWWRVPDEDGILLHSLSWAPLLVDYAAVPAHDTSTFDEWTLDGDYVFRNAQGMKHIHVVQDSDEIFLASWGPLAERPVNRLKVPFGQAVLAGMAFRQSFWSAIFDPLKRRIFFLPVRWHARPLNNKWTIAEARAERQLRRWVRPDGPLTYKMLARAIEIVGSLVMTAMILWFYRQRVVIMAGRILRGDREAMRRVIWFLRAMVFRRTSVPISDQGGP